MAKEGELSPALSIGVIGSDDEGEAAIIFWRTSRILSCKQSLVGNISECLAWKVEVAWFVGNNPFSWNSCITKFRRWSKVFRRLDVIAVGDPEDSKFSKSTIFKSAAVALYTKSGLKSGPKNFWEPHGVVEVDMGVLASDPKPSPGDDTFRLLFL